MSIFLLLNFLFVEIQIAFQMKQSAFPKLTHYLFQCRSTSLAITRIDATPRRRAAPLRLGLRLATSSSRCTWDQSTGASFRAVHLQCNEYFIGQPKFLLLHHSLPVLVLFARDGLLSLWSDSDQTSRVKPHVGDYFVTPKELIRVNSRKYYNYSLPRRPLTLDFFSFFFSFFLHCLFYIIYLKVSIYSCCLNEHAAAFWGFWALKMVTAQAREDCTFL